MSKIENASAISALLAKPTISVCEYAAVMEISRGSAYQAANSGEVEGAFRIGKIFRIPTAPLRRRLGLGG